MPFFSQKISFQRFLFTLSSNIVILILLLLGIEYLCSLVTDKLYSNLIPDIYLNHKWKPYYSQKHDEWIRDNLDFPTPYIHYYNKQGWIESYDVTKEKESGTYRIFYFGDSFTEGTCPMSQSVPSRVEQRLNELAQGTNTKFEVINTGTSSYSPTLHYLLLRHVVVEYSPDLLIINVDMTDDYDDWKYRQTLVSDDDGNPFAAPPRDILSTNFIDTKNGGIQMTPLRKLQLFLLKNSYSFNLLLQIKNKFFSTLENIWEENKPSDLNKNFYQRWSWCQEEWGQETVRNVSFTFSMLARIASFAGERGIKVMFTAVPHYQQYNGGVDGRGKPVWSSRPHFEIQKLAEEIKVPYLNSFEALMPFIKGTPHARYYYVRDMHFNPRGYEIWANSHLQFLVNPENFLLPNEFIRKH